MENENRLLNSLIEELHRNVVQIPAGTFLRGDNRYFDESPAYEVFIDEFSMHRYLITNLQYATFLNILRVQNVSDGTYLFLNAYNKSVRIREQNGHFEVQADFEMHPVTGVNWFGAYFFSLAVGARLPTEAEWEKACRGGLRGVLFPWGNDLPTPSRANFGENVGKTTVVGNYSANAYGLYDMSGNVWEWTTDWYHPKEYANANSINPTGPINGVDKVIRGGGWAYSGDNLRCSKRGRTWAKLGGTNIGFRSVVDFKKPKRILPVQELRKELIRFKSTV